MGLGMTGVLVVTGVFVDTTVAGMSTIVVTVVVEMTGVMMTEELSTGVVTREGSSLNSVSFWSRTDVSVDEMTWESIELVFFPDFLLPGFL